MSMEEQMAANELRLEYVPLDQVALWDSNPKKHDIGSIAESIKRHGFKDPPKFEPELNGGKGGIVEGNGRLKTLQTMKRQGADLPRGLREVDDEWAVPVLFGVDATSEKAAEAYAVDHNNLTMAGGDFTAWDMSRMWDEDAYIAVLEGLAEVDELPVSLDGDDLDGLLMVWEEPPDLDDLAEEYGEPNQKDFWAKIELKLDPETHRQYVSLMKQAPGTEDNEKFAAVMGAVDEDLLVARISD